MSFSICGRPIGTGYPSFVILEVGINHNGELPRALEMVRVARQVGADAVKFQTFKAAEFVSNRDLLFTYRSQGREVTEPMLDMFSRYEFSRAEWETIKSECDAQGIAFMSTPQNAGDMELLRELDVPALKVGSDDFTNIPLLETYASTGLPLVISCGMADLGEVYEALKATRAREGNVALLVCTSQYPTPPGDTNLRRISTLTSAFPNMTIGFSDHTEGPLAAAAAVALGATIFEKHFTLDRDLPGPDHWFSENPTGAKGWIDAIRTAEQLLGSPVVEPTQEELNMRHLARRSLTLLEDVKPGDEFTTQNLGLRRPGSGLSPKWYHLILGKKAKRQLAAGSQIGLEDIG